MPFKINNTTLSHILINTTPVNLKINNVLVHSKDSQSSGSEQDTQLQTPVLSIDSSRTRLYWSSISNATQYNIYKSSTQNGQYAVVGITTDNYYELNSNWVNDWFIIEALDSSGTYQTSNTSNKIQYTPPAPKIYIRFDVETFCNIDQVIYLSISVLSVDEPLDINNVSFVVSSEWTVHLIEDNKFSLTFTEFETQNPGFDIAIKYNNSTIQTIQNYCSHISFGDEAITEEYLNCEVNLEN